jgi:replicative DNA helicase
MLLQLNRGNTSRVDKRPLSSDSRDSGAIEQDVDSWTGLYRDSVYNTDSPWKNITEIIVRLHRHGEIGTCYQQITSYGFVDVNEHDVARLVHMEESAPAKKVKTNDF